MEVLGALQLGCRSLHKARCMSAAAIFPHPTSTQFRCLPLHSIVTRPSTSLVPLECNSCSRLCLASAYTSLWRSSSSASAAVSDTSFFPCCISPSSRPVSFLLLPCSGVPLFLYSLRHFRFVASAANYRSNAAISLLVPPVVVERRCPAVPQTRTAAAIPVEVPAAVGEDIAAFGVRIPRANAAEVFAAFRERDSAAARRQEGRGAYSATPLADGHALIAVAANCDGAVSSKDAAMAASSADDIATAISDCGVMDNLPAVVTVHVGALSTILEAAGAVEKNPFRSATSRSIAALPRGAVAGVAVATKETDAAVVVVGAAAPASYIRTEDAGNYSETAAASAQESSGTAGLTLQNSGTPSRMRRFRDWRGLAQAVGCPRSYVADSITVGVTLHFAASSSKSLAAAAAVHTAAHSCRYPAAPVQSESCIFAVACDLASARYAGGAAEAASGTAAASLSLLTPVTAFTPAIAFFMARFSSTAQYTATGGLGVFSLLIVGRKTLPTPTAAAAPSSSPAAASPASEVFLPDHFVTLFGRAAGACTLQPFKAANKGFAVIQSHPLLRDGGRLHIFVSPARQPAAPSLFSRVATGSFTETSSLVPAALSLSSPAAAFEGDVQTPSSACKAAASVASPCAGGLWISGASEAAYCRPVEMQVFFSGFSDTFYLPGLSLINRRKSSQTLEDGEISGCDVLIRNSSPRQKQLLLDPHVLQHLQTHKQPHAHYNYQMVTRTKQQPQCEERFCVEQHLLQQEKLGNYLQRPQRHRSANESPERPQQQTRTLHALGRVVRKGVNKRHSSVLAETYGSSSMTSPAPLGRGQSIDSPDEAVPMLLRWRPKKSFKKRTMNLPSTKARRRWARLRR